MPAYKDEKRGVWYIKGKKKDHLGNWKDYKRYRDNNKNNFKTKKEALKYEELFLKEKPGTTLTLNDIQDKFIEFNEKHKTLSANTLQYRKSSYEKHVRNDLGKKRISKISKKDIKIFRDNLYGKMKNASLNNLISNISILFKFAINELDLDIDYPFKTLTQLPIESNTVYNVLEVEEFERFKSFIDDDFYIVIFQVLYYTGCRIGEVLAFTWKDYKNGFLEVNKAITSSTIHKPKTKNSYRKIKLDTATKKILDNYKEKQKQIDGFNESWFIFGGAKNTYDVRIRNYKNKIVKKNNLKNFRLHDLRHSHASYLINNNIPTVAVADRLGDRIDTVLTTYTHFFDSTNQQIIDLIDNENGLKKD